MGWVDVEPAKTYDNQGSGLYRRSLAEVESIVSTQRGSGSFR